MREKITLRQLVYSDEWNGDIVYFIGSNESNKVKIGKSSNDKFTGRLVELQISSPYKLTVFGIIQGGTKKEANLHKRFSGSHYRGEWFEFTDDITGYIESETSELILPRKLDTPKCARTKLAKSTHRRKQNKGDFELKITPLKLCPKCGRVFEIRRHTDKCRRCKR